jgi:hydroxyacylglutathione hydrolase
MPIESLPLKVRVLPVLEDNYIFMIEGGDDFVAVVDPAAAAPVVEALAGRRLKMILNTHHHFDHIGGNRQLKELYNCEVVAPKNDQGRIPVVDRWVDDSDRIEIGGHVGEVIFIPGHTRSHIAYLFLRHEPQLAFVGDTMFAMGCGKLFEGTPRQMWDSLQRLSGALRDDALVYCTHEYTEANGRFAAHVDADNAELKARLTDVAAKRKIGEFTVPTTMGLERATNPFVRAPDVDTFARLRLMKDNFR